MSEEEKNDIPLKCYWPTMCRIKDDQTYPLSKVMKLITVEDYVSPERIKEDIATQIKNPIFSTYEFQEIAGETYMLGSSVNQLLNKIALYDLEHRFGVSREVVDVFEEVAKDQYRTIRQTIHDVVESFCLLIKLEERENKTISNVVSLANANEEEKMSEKKVEEYDYDILTYRHWPHTTCRIEDSQMYPLLKVMELISVEDYLNSERIKEDIVEKNKNPIISQNKCQEVVGETYMLGSKVNQLLNRIALYDLKHRFGVPRRAVEAFERIAKKHYATIRQAVYKAVEYSWIIIQLDEKN